MSSSSGEIQQHMIARSMCRVVARVRPVQDFELQRGDGICAYPADRTTLRLISNTTKSTGGTAATTTISSRNTQQQQQQQIEANSFTFDHVFGSDTSQAQLYEITDMTSCCEAVLQGHGVCVIGYGISSSGKTYSLSGPPSSMQLLCSGVESGVVTDEFARYIGHGGNLFSPSRGAVAAVPLASSSSSSSPSSSSAGGDCLPQYRAAFDSLGLQHRAGVYLVKRTTDLCAQLSRQQPSSSPLVQLKACMYEVYNDQVYCLLNVDSESDHHHPNHNTAAAAAPSGRKPLKVRMSATGGFFSEGLLVVTITSLEDLFAVLAEGEKNRRRSPVSDSTRSHVIFSLGVENLSVFPPVTGKINFVDLAGSERETTSALYHFQQHQSSSSHSAAVVVPTQRVSVKPGAFADVGPSIGVSRETEQAEIRSVEIRSINQSLLTLGKVISALAANSLKIASSSSLSSAQQHQQQQLQLQYVPFRDSLLTKLLCDSLTGSSLVLLLACVTPSSRFLDETRNTLSYAAMARSISHFRQTAMAANSRIRASDSSSAGNNLSRENMQLRREVEWLRQENAELRNCLYASNGEKQATQLKLQQMLALQQKKKQEEEEEEEMMKLKQQIETVNASSANRDHAHKKATTVGAGGGGGGSLFSNFDQHVPQQQQQQPNADGILAAREDKVVLAWTASESGPLDAVTSMIVAPLDATTTLSNIGDHDAAAADHHIGDDDGEEDVGDLSLSLIVKQQQQQQHEKKPGEIAGATGGSDPYLRGFDEGHRAAVKTLTKEQGQQQQQQQKSGGESEASLRSEIDELRRIVLELSSKFSAPSPVVAAAAAASMSSPSIAPSSTIKFAAVSSLKTVAIPSPAPAPPVPAVPTPQQPRQSISLFGGSSTTNGGVGASPATPAEAAAATSTVIRPASGSVKPLSLGGLIQ